ncbi:PREDICTED: scavenger receptor class B member 1-like [Polistes dominula]|uniref:Scavenger receptor class B member 1-like n=1 Tax=Polistes dominula TaxID=743375 RepID=A0ABM1II97_POLDO|nr:PREDICTED: scavenger receptor class B member 1-like [Polistes dominula]XP_015179934.1 PREDICTED: scavenger receptor class B member 1-like [Polistes dominula]
MKSTVPFQQFKKCIILFIVGIICSILSYTIYIVNPIKKILDYNLEMRPNSLIFSVWKKPPIEVFNKVYIFNITNPVEFLKGTEKLKLQEIGPYVYQEFLEHTNITFNDNGTLTYIPRRTVFFVPELSISDPEKDFVYVPNIGMLGITSALSDAGFFTNYLVTQLTNMIGSEPILNLTAYDFLWGYDDNLVKLATGILPSYLHFKKLGLLDRMYDEGENIVNINIRKNDDMRDENGRYFSIQTYNGSPGMSHWGYREETENKTYPENTRCNSIRGASEGAVFPPNLDKRAVFRVYRKSFCRTVPIVFKKDIYFDGNIPTYLYDISDDFLDPPDKNPDNECYCRKLKKCYKKGLSDLTACYYHIPSAVSLPHFLRGDPSLLEDVEGLNPNPEKHSTRIEIQPDVGLVVKINSRIQSNLVIHNTQYNPKVKPFNNKTIPLFWSDLTTAPLSSNWLFQLRLIVISPVIQTIVIYLLIISGIILITLSLISSIWIINQHRHQQSEFIRRDSADLRIPLKYDQNTTIHILPNIQNIKSNSDSYS